MTVSPLLRSLDDHSRVGAMLVALAGDIDDLHSIVLNGDPPSKARPRFGRGGRAYTPAESRAAEARTRGMLARSMPEPMTGNVALVAVFYRPNAQRIDTDNMVKHLLDAANGVLWVDDSQVTAIAAVTELDRAHPRTLVAFAPHATTMLRGTDDTLTCQQCSKPFPRPRGRVQRYCSDECRKVARVNVREPMACRHCGQLFRRTTSRQVLCSEACRAAWLTGRKKAAAKPPSTCTECGKTLTHKRGGRCRDCWRASPLTIPAEAPPITGGQQ